MASPNLPCSRCGKLPSRGRGEFYLVDIRAVVDPSSPYIIEDDHSDDLEREIADLLKRINALSETQLIAEVYQRKLHSLCSKCYVEWMADPFSRDCEEPRSSR